MKRDRDRYDWSEIALLLFLVSIVVVALVLSLHEALTDLLAGVRAALGG